MNLLTKVYYKSKMTESILTKLGFSFLAGTAAELFFATVEPFIFMVLFLVVADLITGISAARNRKEKISSWGLRRTIQKFTLYSIAIVLSQGMEQVFNIPQVVYIVALFICATEFLSNLENIGEVTGVNVAAKVKELLASKLNS